MDDDTGDRTHVAEPSDGAASTAGAADDADDAERVVCRAMDQLIVQQEDDDDAMLACTHQEEGEGDSSPTEEVEGEEPEGEEEDEERELKQEVDLKREETVKERLERLRASENDALHAAAKKGDLDDVKFLLQHGKSVSNKNWWGETELIVAAENGRFDVVRELIDRGADVDAKDDGGGIALVLTAQSGHFDVVLYLLQRGANGKAKDNDGTTVLSYAAAQGLVRVAKELITNGALVDAATIQGRTPLFYAAEHGHLDMVQLLLKAGASLWTKAHSCPPSRESETALLLAGRTGHMNIFQFLINAGAPVNVRSGEDGETPLISSARWDFFAGVQLLIAHGGCLCEDEVAEDEYSLIPGTLKTMRLFCDTTFEFEPMCSRVLIRVEEICSKLQESDATRAKESTLVSFVSILFRFCRLQIDIGKRESSLLRLIGSRAIANRIRDFHEELDHFVGMLALEQNENRWKEQWDDDQTQLLVRFDEKLSTDEALLYGFDSEAGKQETAVLLLYELKVCCQERHMSVLQASLERVMERFLRVCNMDMPVIPKWFISRDDVEFHSWNLVRSEGEHNNKIQYYKGKWRKTNVMIETFPVASTFVQAASQWYQLNHPNMVKLFGACHIGSPPFFIYELETQGVPLDDFLNKDVNRPLVWKCLYEAALGLRYLHSRGVAHGFLQSRSFTVGSGITKLNGTRQIGIQRRGGDTSTDVCLPPEGFYGHTDASNETTFSRSEAYDIYAFGICIWEALTLELPWRDFENREMWGDKLSGRLPDHPASIGDSEWDLISKVCAAEPSERVRMNYVVNRLSKFVIARDRVSEAASQEPSPSKETENKIIDGHGFADPDGRTIPNALQYIGSGCEKLEGHHWMSSNVYPALEYIFALLQERQKTPMDADVLQFCTSLSRF